MMKLTRFIHLRVAVALTQAPTFISFSMAVRKFR